MTVFVFFEVGNVLFNDTNTGSNREKWTEQLGEEFPTVKNGKYTAPQIAQVRSRDINKTASQHLQTLVDRITGAREQVHLVLTGPWSKIQCLATLKSRVFDCQTWRNRLVGVTPPKDGLEYKEEYVPPNDGDTVKAYFEQQGYQTEDMSKHRFAILYGSPYGDYSRLFPKRSVFVSHSKLLSATHVNQALEILGISTRVPVPGSDSAA